MTDPTVNVLQTMVLDVFRSVRQLQLATVTKHSAVLFKSLNALHPSVHREYFINYSPQPGAETVVYNALILAPLLRKCAATFAEEIAKRMMDVPASQDGARHHAPSRQRQLAKPVAQVAAGDMAADVGIFHFAVHFFYGIGQALLNELVRLDRV